LRQEIKAEGIPTDLLSVDRTLEPYDTFKSLILQEKVKAYPVRDKMYDYPVENLLEEELKGLVLIDGKKVDHTETSTKDLSDAVCAVVYNCTRYENMSSSAFTWRTVRA